MARTDSQIKNLIRLKIATLEKVIRRGNRSFAPDIHNEYYEAQVEILNEILDSINDFYFDPRFDD